MLAVKDVIRRALRPVVPAGLRQVINRADARLTVSRYRRAARRNARRATRLALAPVVNQFRHSFARPRVDLYRMPHYRGEFFPANGRPQAWLDRPDAERKIDRRLGKGLLTQTQAEYCRSFCRDGFVAVPGLLSHDFLDRVWGAYQAAADAGCIRLLPPKAAGDPWPDRRLDPHLVVPELREVLEHRDLLDLCRLFLGTAIAPYQTIAAHKGSQQRAHSDAIHMTTYPLGYMIAAWIAFEDIHPNSGPLFYYPGSHRLPYLLSREVGMAPGANATDQYGPYTQFYEPRIAQVIADNKLELHSFTARKGDVLFWHHNLIHGGARRRDLARSRKSVVCHYFARGAIAYHDLTGGLARIDTGDRGVALGYPQGQ